MAHFLIENSKVMAFKDIFVKYVVNLKTSIDGLNANEAMVVSRLSFLVVLRDG